MRPAGCLEPLRHGRRSARNGLEASSCPSVVDRYGRDAVVYPGHGGETTLGRELDTNPFLRELRVAAPE